ncbi:MAG: hypothetical protein DWQ01_06030 [Planctomycetota bacterium]|nr:MAG: hypothetical protein DWQ01_06030 [Planctomycetota bacterium]
MKDLKFAVKIVGGRAHYETIQWPYQGKHQLSLKDVGFLRIRLPEAEELVGDLELENILERTPIFPWSSPWSNQQSLVSAVALNKEFRAVFNTPDGRRWEGKGLGPKLPGETSEIQLKANPTIKFLGRILQASGETVEKGNWEADLVLGAGRGRFYFRTDKNGRFSRHFPLDPGQEFLEIQKLSLIPNDSRWNQSSSTNWGVLRGLGRVYAGEKDLGDVKLESQLPLVAGRVVDRNGNGVEGADLYLEYLEKNTHPRLPDKWERLWNLKFNTSDQDGYFECMGESPEKPLRLNVSGRKHLLKEPLQFSAFDQNVEVVVEGSNYIVGRYLLPDGMGLHLGEKLLLELWFENIESRKVWKTELRSRGKENSFRSERLFTGRYKASLRAPEGRILAEFPEIEVPGGEPVTIPQFQPLDLSDWLQVNEITFLDFEGNPISGSVNIGVMNGDMNSMSIHSVSLEEGGKFRLLSLRDFGQQFRFHYLDFPPVYWSSWEGNSEVRFKKAIPVVLRIPRLFAPNSEGQNVGLKFVFKESIDSRIRGNRLRQADLVVDLNRDFEIPFEIPGEGIYEVKWYICFGTEMRFITRETFGEEVKILENSEGKTIRLKVPPAFQNWPEIE